VDASKLQEQVTLYKKQVYMFGTIRVYKADKGWGFLITKNQKQIFFHISEFILEGDNDVVPTPGDYVQFELGDSKRRGYPNEAKGIKVVRTAFQHNKTTESSTAENILAGNVEPFKKTEGAR
jgi:cold shock CspA family protein